MFGYRQYQPYGLSQAIPTLPYPHGLSVTSLTARINRYPHTHSGLACNAVLPLGSVTLTSDCCLFQHQITSDFYIAV